MERSTGKTMDAFVELENVGLAHALASSFRTRCEQHRVPRIGDRQIWLEISSQEELMKELFPKAKCVEWHGQQPHVHQPREAFDSGFMGFLTGEEMTMVVKHAEMPQRVSDQTPPLDHDRG